MKILNDFKLKIKIPVAWIDMDVLGHVNSSKYFTYFETSRIGYYQKLGLLDYFTSQNINGVVARTECSYFVPVTYPDNITTGARITGITQDTLTMEHFVKSDLRGLAAIGETEIVFFDFNTQKKIPVPQLVIQKIKEFEENKIV